MKDWCGDISREKTFAEELITLLPELGDYLKAHPDGGASEPPVYMCLLLSCNRALRKAVLEAECHAADIKRLYDDGQAARRKLMELKRAFEITCDILSAGKSGIFGG